MRSVENTECGKCRVWKMRSVESAECVLFSGKCGVWKMRSVFIYLYKTVLRKHAR